MSIDHLRVPKRAGDFLGEKLRQGSLALFLGAGASSGQSLPQWPELVRRLRVSVGLDASGISDSTSADDLQFAADEVKRNTFSGDETAFAKRVKQCLYAGVLLSGEMLRTDLLIAIAALVAGSRRGSITRVMTLNFDSTLEWYVSLYGLVPRVVVEPPELEGAEDLRIYHPHGFLAHPDLALKDSGFVILGADSVNTRLGTPGDPWFELMRHTLSTSVGLFVGMSFRSFQDRAIAPLLTTIGKNQRVLDRGPTGIWLCVLESSEFVGNDRDTVIERQAQAFISNNIVPVFLEKYADVPRFLLSICQKAALNIIV